MPKATFLNLPDEKRLRITELAIDEFSTHPYRQASLSRIVSRAGIAKGSMYQYFDNKLDLYQWLVVEELPRRRQAWLEHNGAGSGEDLFDTVEQRALTSIGFLLAHPRLARLAATAMEPTSDAELRTLHETLRQEEIEQLTETIREAQSRGEVRGELDPHALAHMIEALVLHGLPQAVLARSSLDVHGLLQDPDRGREIEEEGWRELVRQSLALIRSGITAGKAHIPMDWHREEVPTPTVIES